MKLPPFPETEPQKWLNISFAGAIFACLLPFFNLGALLPGTLPVLLKLSVLLFSLHGIFLIVIFVPPLILNGVHGIAAELGLKKITKEDLKQTGKLFFPLFLTITVFSGILTWIAKAFGYGNPEQAIVQIALKGDFEIFLLIALSAVFVAPFTEELIFRKIIYSSLRRWYSGIGAAGITSALFAMVHAAIWQTPAFFLLALFFQYTYLNSNGSTTRCILLHSAYNLCAVLGMLGLRLSGISI